MTEFKEVGRVKASNATDIVISRVVESGITKGFNINSFVTTAKYTGFIKGVYVPGELIEQFSELVKKAMSQ